MEALFIPRDLRLDVRLSLKKYDSVEIPKGTEVLVHSHKGMPITHLQYPFIGVEMVTIYHDKHFINIPLYYLEEDKSKTNEEE